MENAVVRGSIRCGEIQMPYLLVRKPVKNINIHVRTDGTAVVSAAEWVPAAEVEHILQKKSRFLLSARERIKQCAVLQPPVHQYESGEQFRVLGQMLTLQVQTGFPASVQRQGAALFLRVPAESTAKKRKAQMDRWLRDTCQAIFTQAALQAQDLLADRCLPQNITLRVRRMISRWGSCIPTKHVVTFSTHLLETPAFCVQAVVLHEYVHFLHPDHSRAFYAELERVMPDYRQQTQLLKSPAYAVFYNE